MNQPGLKLLAAALFTVCLGGCSNTANMDGFWCDLSGTPTTYTQAPLPANLLPAFPRNCLAGDFEMMSERDCLQTPGGCYQLDTGNWCTAGTLTQCPEGSEAIAIEVDCPEGGQCWMYSPTLRCHTTQA